ncbi:hypothetical protein [Streptomyces parvulus]|uniref:Amidohydrolase-related domain-containing protein n=1 Tax=Streptomyces parvulus TaxID=146923 RepID=A0ABV5D8R1_9ACTN
MGLALCYCQLYDAHVHMNSLADLTELVAQGVTTGLDMACFPVEQMRSFRGKVPDIRSVGTPAIGPGGPLRRDEREERIGFIPRSDAGWS